jgi:hypothetical protein
MRGPTRTTARKNIFQANRRSWAYDAGKIGDAEGKAALP